MPSAYLPSLQECLLVDLGLIGYADACAVQRQVAAACKAGIIANALLLCQHPHVITLGRSGKPEHLLASQQLLRQMGVEFSTSDRGGDITYHGPGQVVGYPILNLAHIRKDVVWYVRQLEEAMIRATADFGIAATRQPAMTGVWVETPAGTEKLAAIGVHVSRWITSHGFAYNVATDLRYFDLIVPCGIANRKPTSLERLLGRSMHTESAAQLVVGHLAALLGLRLRHASREELENRLDSQPALAL